MRAASAILGSIALAAATAAAGAAAPAAPPRQTTVHVTPARGGPHTVFTLVFRAEEATGTYGAQRRVDVLTVTRRRITGGGGCVAMAQLTLPAVEQGSQVHVRLDPRTIERGSAAGAWCVATYDGQIQELESPVCNPGQACPAYIRLLGTVGRFSFSVRAPLSPPPSPSADGTPPRFAGLARAFACTPGPQRPGQTTPFTLSWQAATDNATPSSQLVYDVYLASTAGGENFRAPTWVSAAGATTFRTPGLASHGSFYFIVRARDAAGNEDRNTVEVHGSDPCL